MKKEFENRLVVLRVLPVALAFVACVPTFEDDTSRITEVRVLAVRSEPAEPKPGDEVRLSALLVGPDAVDDPPTDDLSWSLCALRKPLTEPGPVAEECIESFGAESEHLTELGQGPSVTGFLPSDVCRFFGPLPPRVTGSEDAVGRPVEPDQTGGYYQPVLVGSEDQEAASPELGAIRLLCGGANLPKEELIEFNQGYRPNENPEIQEGFLERPGASIPLAFGGEGEPLAVEKGEQINLRLVLDDCPTAPVCGDGICTAGENASDCPDDCRTEPVGCTGAEPYLVADPETKRVKEATERIEISWFASAGKFSSAITDNSERATEVVNDWTAPETGGSVRLWLVARDSRRGVSWREVALEVTE